MRQNDLITSVNRFVAAPSYKVWLLLSRDTACLHAGRPARLAFFVSDEKSSIQWLLQHY